MKKSMDDLFKAVLTSEQFAAFKEELSGGIKKVNSMVEGNEKMKAKKDLILETSKKIDAMIESSDKSPVIFKVLYSSVKEAMKKMIQPFIDQEIEEKGYEDLDDVPDVPQKESVKKEEVKQNNTHVKNTSKNRPKKPLKTSVNPSKNTEKPKTVKNRSDKQVQKPVNSKR